MSHFVVDYFFCFDNLTYCTRVLGHQTFHATANDLLQQQTIYISVSAMRRRYDFAAWQPQWVFPL